jgi:hypothetical protein
VHSISSGRLNLRTTGLQVGINCDLAVNDINPFFNDCSIRQERFIMKQCFIAFSMVISLFCVAEWAIGAGAHCATLDQQWRKVQAWQEIQKKKWKEIECKAERMTEDLGAHGGVSKNKSKRPGY